MRKGRLDERGLGFRAVAHVSTSEGQDNMQRADLSEAARRKGDEPRTHATQQGAPARSGRNYIEFRLRK